MIVSQATQMVLEHVTAFQGVLVSKVANSAKKSAVPIHLVINALFRSQIQSQRKVLLLPQLGCDYHAERRR